MSHKLCVFRSCFPALLPKSLFPTSYPELALHFLLGMVNITFWISGNSADIFSSSFSVSTFRITPSRLHLFETESVYFTCKGFNISTDWKVRNAREIISQCSNGTATKTCRIDHASASDSGEYWCESGAERSHAVSITVSSGAVILESPAHAVVEGDAVTLHCRNKITSSNFTADFYKDNFFMGTRYEGKLEIPDVSESHEGLYKCRIHGVGESPETWVAIRRKSNAGKGMFFLHFFQFICLLVAWMNL
uniref:Immunoglobulin domain-containing protein n=1 Tax=Oreochromis aureus TaxID=47969 RepID=A0A668W4T8_OREAU